MYSHDVNRLFCFSHDFNYSLQHENALHALANALLKYETLSADEIKRILNPYQQVQLPEQQEGLALT